MTATSLGPVRPIWVMRADRGCLNLTAAVAQRPLTEEKPVLAYDYPLLSVFWTTAFFFMWAACSAAVVWSFVDNLRRHDHSASAKALWAVVIILFPVVGVFAYILGAP